MSIEMVFGNKALFNNPNQAWRREISVGKFAVLKQDPQKQHKDNKMN